MKRRLSDVVDEDLRLAHFLVHQRRMTVGTAAQALGVTRKLLRQLLALPVDAVPIGDALVYWTGQARVAEAVKIAAEAQRKQRRRAPPTPHQAKKPHQPRAVRGQALPCDDDQVAAFIAQRGITRCPGYGEGELPHYGWSAGPMAGRREGKTGAPQPKKVI